MLLRIENLFLFFFFRFVKSSFFFKLIKTKVYKFVFTDMHVRTCCVFIWISTDYFVCLHKNKDADVVETLTLYLKVGMAMYFWLWMPNIIKNDICYTQFLGRCVNAVSLCELIIEFKKGEITAVRCPFHFHQDRWANTGSVKRDEIC